ncbi:MAG: hypothetical protein HC774_01875 [Sphingomonadales bacterium]|nr:hypothetical protein [Sphingomonadales bacterium]
MESTATPIGIDAAPLNAKTHPQSTRRAISETQSKGLDHVRSNARATDPIMPAMVPTPKQTLIAKGASIPPGGGPPPAMMPTSDKKIMIPMAFHGTAMAASALIHLEACMNQQGPRCEADKISEGERMASLFRHTASHPPAVIRFTDRVPDGGHHIGLPTGFCRRDIGRREVARESESEHPREN